MKLNKKGETIVETLAAILIVAVCFLMLQTSIVTAAKINKSSSEENVPYNKEGATNLDACFITITRSSNSDLKDDIASCYKTTDENGGYYYYE